MENNIEEIWRDVLGYENMYQVSNLGNVKSLGNDENRKEKILKQGIDTNGYKYMTLCKNGNKKVFKAHKLVAMAFLNHIPDGTMKLVIDHINNNPLDNRLENLQVITQRQNLSKDKKNKTSKYTGVSWSKARNKWQSYIRIGLKLNHLGYYINEEDAHLKYQETLKTLKL